MSTKAIDYKILLKRDGHTQQQRMPQWLQPTMVPIDPRTKDDFFNYLKAIAAQVKFCDSEILAENGTWEDFFNLSADELEILAKKKSVPPHIALWQGFIDLYQLPQQLANNITQRHLDFYFGEVLKLKKNPPRPDQAFVLFELKKNTADFLLNSGTYLLAGKDNTKKERRYRLAHDIIVNKSVVTELQSLYVDPVNKNFIHYAPVANSADGLGSELDRGNPRWSAFGGKGTQLAQIGFCLASEVLKMKEGHRTIEVKLTLTHRLAATKSKALSDLFKVAITGEKGWIGPKTVSGKVSQGDSNHVSFTLEISKEEPSIVGYDSAVHGKNFNTKHPILQVLLNNEKADFGYKELAAAEVEDALIEVKVIGIKDLQLENDFGSIDATKPFAPFGTTPEVNVNFTVRSEEAFSKRLKEFSFDVEWKNIPAPNLGTYFQTYGQGISTEDFKATAAFKDGYNWEDKTATVKLFNTSNAQQNTNWPFISPASPEKCPTLSLPQITVEPYTFAGQSFEQKISSKLAYLMPSFAFTLAKSNYKAVFEAMVNPYKEIRKGIFNLRLGHSFFFKEYRKLYTEEIMRYSKNGDPLKLPAEPFAPEMQSLTLNYTATTSRIKFNGQSLNDFIDEEIEFFHYGAFGQKREHTFLKRQLPFISNYRVNLLPEYEHEGSFFIGFSGLRAEDAVCVLLKAAEGSANPDKPKVEVAWSVLCDNYWKSLGPEDFIFDTTNGLITSGVIKIVVPREATTTTTIMKDGLLWLKAAIKKDTDAVCNLLGVQANAAIVQFEDTNNDPFHLAAPLPANNINKLDPETGAIKSIKQPYASFGGVMQENDDAFYTRVAERLRHKERSISNWDYERMILQHFPAIHKVKCINHASTISFYHPGHVLIIVVPDLLNQNAVDPLKPRTDKNTLENIRTFLKDHSDNWVTHHVSNPYYEPVQISARIKLKIGYEYNYYEKTIDQKLQEYLSPWISNLGNSVHFGGKITQSMIIKYLEEMDFIDFVSDLNLSHSANGGISFVHKELVEASSPAAVLVSHSHHNISNY
ncbi:MAG: baseplate J/gp47 family protein [Anditalea sp.]